MEHNSMSVCVQAKQWITVHNAGIQEISSKMKGQSAFISHNMEKQLGC